MIDIFILFSSGVLPIFTLVCSFLGSLCLILVYFKIATRFKIIDSPNFRSSHKEVTIRGAGFIFPFIFILSSSFFSQGSSSFIFIGGLLMVSVVSFVDDLLVLLPFQRLLFQMLSVALLLLSFVGVTIAAFLVGAILILGCLNAYNFMDGINGITVLYSAISVGSLVWLRKNLGITNLWYDESLLLLFPTLCVFGFYNFRRKAKCFSGDVGAIGMAFIICYGIFEVVISTSNLVYVLLLGIYGLDVVATIVLRIFRKENITQPHRSHLYQFLANEQGFSHLFIASMYALIQIVLSAVVITQRIQVIIFIYSIIVACYIIYRIKYEGLKKLFVSYE